MTNPRLRLALSDDPHPISAMVASRTLLLRPDVLCDRR
jgi:hypothetical protein